jgi:hypothetical protein
MRFSQRIGKKKATKEIQLESIDTELQNGLWNIIKLLFVDPIASHRLEFNGFAIKLWNHFYKLPVDRIPEYEFEIKDFIRKRFFEDEWYESYDFIEFLLNLEFVHYNKKTEFVDTLNSILEREFSGYRIIDNLIAPISNELELEEISSANKNTSQFSSLNGANIHLENALDLLSDRKNPNYRNSIKESISAVEATCRIITNENTLGKALNKLEEKGLNINNQLKAGFDKIYAYTNDKESGIRHAIVQQPNEPDFSDAKYMLVSCSSFINYLIIKAKKIRLKI